MPPPTCAPCRCAPWTTPSGTAESLDGLVIPSTRGQQPLGWADLDRDDFGGCVRAIHHLVLSAADHTYQTVRPQHRAPTRPVGAHVGLLHPAAPVRGSDIRHAAISLCHALIGRAVGQARTRIWIAVDAAILHAVQEPLPNTPAHGALPPRPPKPARPHAR